MLCRLFQVLDVLACEREDGQVDTWMALYGWVGLCGGCCEVFELWFAGRMDCGGVYCF